MHGGLFALSIILFVFPLHTDLSPEPAILSTSYASFACARPVITNNEQSQHYRLGNEFWYFYSCHLLDIVMIHDFGIFAVSYMET